MYLIGVVVFAVAVSLILPGTVWWAELFSIIPPAAYLLIGVLLIGISIYTKSIVLVTLSLMLFAVIFPYADLNLVRFQDLSAIDADLRLVTWNTQYWFDEEDRQAAFELIEDQDADIVLLQEFFYAEDQRPPLLQEIKDAFPEYELYSVGELITLSRLPITEFSFDETEYEPWEGHSRITVNTDSGDVTIFNVHLPVQFRTDHLDDIVGFAQNMQNLFHKRRSAVFELERSLEQKQDTAIIMAGDFNSSSTQWPVRYIAHGFTDAFQASGQTVPATFTIWGATWWRIDWILSKNGPWPVNYQLVDDSKQFSDHTMVRVDYDLSTV